MQDPNNRSVWTETMPREGDLESAERTQLPDASGPPTPSSSPSPGAALTPPETRPWSTWVLEGLRATLFLAPRTGAARPTPWQLLALALVHAALLVAGAWWEVVGSAQFNVRGWLAPMWSSLLLLWCAWWAMAPAQRQYSQVSEVAAQPQGGLAAWYVLSNWAPLLPTLLLYGLLALQAHQQAGLAVPLGSDVFWVLYGVLTVWVIAALVVVTARFVRSGWRTAVFTASLLGVLALATWQFQDRPWEADMSALDAEGAAERPRLVLSQPVFEKQQALWQDQVQALAPERAGVVDVYGLVFAPYAGEEVFRRESSMVSDLLQQRFDAKGRVLHLLNHAETAATHAWATPQNLQRAVAALAALMDREQDVLVVYLTSHGASNHELAASHWPLQVAPVTPEMLRAALDEAGIRHRVIAVSACYAGGWIEPLATDGTLIMTAADATHTSYGCGTRSELTFFGRAVFNEQLRQTYSFTEAFEKAVPLIAQREIEAGKADGFSNPQIKVGTDIAPVLQALETRLAAQAEAAPQAAPANAATASAVSAAPESAASKP